MRFLAPLGLFLLTIAAHAQTIEGTVKTAEGRPVPQAFVAAFTTPVASVTDASAHTRSDDQGRFKLSGLKPASYVVTATSSSLGSTFTQPLPLKSGETRSVDPTLSTGGLRLRGTARGPVGAIAGARILITPEKPNGERIYAAETDVKGRYSLLLPKDRYDLLLVHDGFYAPYQTIELAAEVEKDIRAEARLSGAPAAVREWIRTSAIPLKTVEAGNGFDDMKPLAAIVGDARVVALGEATHGTREFFQLKHRMLEYLVGERGFTVFAIEASFPDALAVNDYVLNGKGDPAKALEGLGFWTWNTEEVLEQIRWMRRWNEDPAHTKKVKFYGFDMQNPIASVRELRKYFAAHDLEGMPLAASALDVIPMDSRNYRQLSAEQQKGVRDALDAIAKRIDAREDRDEPALIARQLVEVLRQEERWMLTNDSFSARDRSMAENVRWILEHEGKGAKVVVWAHNGHIAPEALPYARGGTMGAHLRKFFGPSLVVFGLGFDRGSFQAIKGMLRDHTVGSLAERSFDRVLGANGPPRFALDLRTATGPVRDWLRSPLEHRSIGALYDPDRADSFVQTIHPLESYDAVLFVSETTAARGMDRRATRDNPARRMFAPAPAALNLKFEDGNVGEPPPGWAVGGKDAMRAELVSEGCASGKCVKLTRSDQASFSTLMQRIDGKPFAGKIIHFRARIRSTVVGDSIAQFWLRADLPGGAVGLFDNMMSRQLHSVADWTEYEITGRVEENAEAIAFGLIFQGHGTAWVDEVTLTAE